MFCCDGVGIGVGTKKVEQITTNKEQRTVERERERKEIWKREDLEKIVLEVWVLKGRVVKSQEKLRKWRWIVKQNGDILSY